MTTYFLSGLGADERIFSNLVLPQSIKIKHIGWIPHIAGESLANYTKRLSKQIDITKPFRLVGVSFGGIVATELSKILNPRQIIIISSVAVSTQLPAYFGMMAQGFGNPFFPKPLLKSANPFSYWLFGAATEQSRKLFKEIISQADKNFLVWDIDKIARWDNKKRAQNLYHIHGAHDKIFPVELVNADYIVKAGGHLMVYDKPAEISKVLAERLSSV